MANIRNGKRKCDSCGKWFSVGRMTLEKETYICPGCRKKKLKSAEKTGFELKTKGSDKEKTGALNSPMG